MANKIRGEVEIDIGGKPYTMRPTFEALCEIEGATGKSLIGLANKIGSGDISIYEVAQVIFCGLGGYSKKDRPSFKEVGGEVHSRGLVNMAGVVAGFITSAIGGDEPADSEKNQSSPDAG